MFGERHMGRVSAIVAEWRQQQERMSLGFWLLSCWILSCFGALIGRVRGIVWPLFGMARAEVVDIGMVLR